jgi:hypothetical protein
VRVVRYNGGTVIITKKALDDFMHLKLSRLHHLSEVSSVLLNMTLFKWHLVGGVDDLRKLSAFVNLVGYQANQPHNQLTSAPFTSAWKCLK